MQERVILAAIVFAFLVIQIWAAAHRPLWFDELSTLTVSSVSGLKNLLPAISADGNPPLYFLLARFCLHLPVPVEIALRLPSIVATDITAVMIFLFVRRNTDRLFAFFAMSVFLGSAFALFASMEARPYALLLLFTSIALYCWQSAARWISRRWALAGIAAGTAGATFSHHYGILYVALPLLTGEMARAWQRHKIDFPVLAAMLTGAIALVVTIPTMLHGQAGLLKAVKLCPVFWSRPFLRSLRVYRYTVPIPIAKYVLAAEVIGAFLAIGTFLMFVVFTEKGVSRKLTKSASQVRVEDIVAGSALVLILPLMLLITRFGTGYFVERYAIGSSLGVAIVCGLLTSQWNERLPKIEGFILAGIIYGFLIAFLGLWPFRAFS
jgi:hypothetical protein